MKIFEVMTTFLKEDDHEARMARAELMQIAQNAIALAKIVHEGDDLPGWVSSYITLANDHLNSVHQHMEYESTKKPTLENASAGATCAGNIASVVNPHVTNPYKKGKSKHPVPVSVSALDTKNVSIFGGPLKRNT